MELKEISLNKIVKKIKRYFTYIFIIFLIFNKYYIPNCKKDVLLP